jgi:hypothetical protein
VLLGQTIGDPATVRDGIGNPPFGGRVQGRALGVDCCGVVLQVHPATTPGDHPCVKQHC